MFCVSAILHQCCVLKMTPIFRIQKLNGSFVWSYVTSWEWQTHLTVVSTHWHRRIHHLPCIWGTSTALTGSTIPGKIFQRMRLVRYPPPANSDENRDRTLVLCISQTAFSGSYTHTKTFFLLLVYWWACCSFSPDFPLFLCDLIWFFSQLAVSRTHKCTPVRDVLMKPNIQSNSDETNSNQQEWRSCLLCSTLCLPASGFVCQSDKKNTDTSCFCIFATVTQHIEEVCAESPQWCSCITIPVGFKRLTITLTNWGPLWQCMESFTDPWALARVQILERYSALPLPVQHLGQRTRTSSHLRPEDAAGWDVSNNLVQCLRWTVRAEVHKSQYGRVWRH